MSTVIIEKPTDASLIAQMEEIFFESSTRKSFQSEAEKEAFKWQYLGFYLSHYPELVWIARKGSTVLGYCLGATRSDDPRLLKIQPHLAVFKHQFSEFPAHLHINCHQDARGQGIGQKLIKKFETDLQRTGIKGLHIITSPHAINRSFYQRLGLTTEIEDVFQGRPILFMGKRINL